MNKKIVFDMDDILWGLNEKATKLANVDYNKLVSFITQDNPVLNDDEKARMLSTYNSLELFRDIHWFDGVVRLNELKADVHIVSNIFALDIGDIKRTQLLNILTIPTKNIHLNLVRDAKKKTIDNDTFIFVDDSPYNIANSPAEHNIMLARPWNTSKYGKEILGSTKYKMFDSLNEIIDYIETLL